MILYQLHELQHAAVAPFRLLAEATQQIYTNPLLPMSYTRLGRAIAAGAELVERTTRRRPKPAFKLHSTIIDGTEVPVHEVVVAETPFCSLLRFEREAAGTGDSGRGDPRVLVVAPLSGHFATLLRGTVEALLPDHDVYITDWKDARGVPLSAGPFHLDDYVETIMQHLRLLGPDVHVIAVCQPSPPVLAAVSLLAQQKDPAAPRSMTLMGGPVDTRINPTQVNRLATTRPMSWFERSVITRVPAHYAGSMRRVYPGFIQLQGFMSMNLDRHLGAHIQLFEHLVQGDGDGAAAHRRFYDEYLSVMDLPAEFYLDTIRGVFQEHLLPRGLMQWRGIRVEPAAITATGLMTVEGEFDDISGIGQTQAAHGLCPNIPDDRRQHHVQGKVGHYGIFNGRRWREEILPRLRRFIRENAAAPG